MEEQLSRDVAVLRMDPATRRVVTSITAFIVATVVGGTLLSIAGIIRNPNPPATLVAMATAFVLFGGLLAASLFRARVVLYPDAIEITRGLAPARRLTRAEVIGRRLHPSGWYSAPYHILLTRDGTEVNLPPFIERSRQLQAWLNDIPLVRTR